VPRLHISILPPSHFPLHVFHHIYHPLFSLFSSSKLIPFSPLPFSYIIPPILPFSPSPYSPFPNIFLPNFSSYIYNFPLPPIIFLNIFHYYH